MAILTVDSLVYRHDDGATALNDMRLAVEQRTITVISGRNGAGKTLLAMALCGHLRLDALRGTMRIAHNSSVSTEPLTREILRAHCAIVFQHAEHQVIGQTVADDIKFGIHNISSSRADIDRRATHIMEELAITHLAHRHPLTLSGGELRRVAIASMLVLNPSILFLDEPFVNLDWRGIQEITALITRLRERGRTTVVITHQLSSALPIADYVLLLSAGEITARGAPNEILPAARSDRLISPHYRLTTASH